LYYFHAEDGIRDLTVTGVQTCALPICPRTTSPPTRPAQVASWSAAAARNVSAAPRTTVCPSATSTRAILPQVVVLPDPLTPTTRSEERRVGKEGWCRQAGDEEEEIDRD